MVCVGCHVPDPRLGDGGDGACCRLGPYARAQRTRGAARGRARAGDRHVDASGRSRGADIEIPVDDLSVSKRHCRLIVENGRLFVRDLGSTNGTFVNGHPVSGLFPIEPGDRLGMGHTEVDISR